jgi:hypothetical protein
VGLRVCTRDIVWLVYLIGVMKFSATNIVQVISHVSRSFSGFYFFRSDNCRDCTVNWDSSA